MPPLQGGDRRFESGLAHSSYLFGEHVRAGFLDFLKLFGLPLPAQPNHKKF